MREIKEKRAPRQVDHLLGVAVAKRHGLLDKYVLVVGQTHHLFMSGGHRNAPCALCGVDESLQRTQLPLLDRERAPRTIHMHGEYLRNDARLLTPALNSIANFVAFSFVDAATATTLAEGNARRQRTKSFAMAPVPTMPHFMLMTDDAENSS
jgi:hypothetical protein